MFVQLYYARCTNVYTIENGGLLRLVHQNRIKVDKFFNLQVHLFTIFYKSMLARKGQKQTSPERLSLEIVGTKTANKIN